MAIARKNGRRKNGDGKGGSSAHARLVKLYYQIIQCFHHIATLRRHLDAETLPDGLSRKVEELNGFCKPAIPNDDIYFAIWNVNFEWAKSTIKAMLNHYNEQLGSIRTEVVLTQAMPHLDLGRAKSNAIRWAKNNYNRKLDINAISSFYDFVRPIDPSQQPIQNLAQATPLVMIPTVAPQSQMKKRLRSPETSPPVTKRVDNKISPLLPLDSGPRDMLFEASLIPLPDSPLGNLNDPNEYPPLPQRERVNGSKSGPRTGASQKSPQSSQPSGLKTPSPTGKLPQPSFSPTPGPSNAPEVRPIKFANRPQQPTMLERNIFWKFRHEIENKIDWRLPVLTNKVLIFGASNLSRINVEPHPETQVACYPGAKLCHARGLIQKYTGSFKPEKIVINIGINDMNEPISSSKHRLMLLLSAIKSKFPKTAIYFAKLNYSSRLTAQQKLAIQSINSTAESSKSVTVIPALRLSEFNVVKDNIHWTEKTANSMYSAWLKFLNLN